MRVVVRFGAAIVIVVGALAPTCGIASAAVTVSRASDGALHVGGTAAAERIVVQHSSTGELRVVASGETTLTLQDALCVVDEVATTMTCPAPSTRTTIDLGGGRDVLRIEGGGSYSVVDPSALDTIDVAAADDGVSVFWSRPLRRLVASCAGCAARWSILLPGRPRLVITGPYDDSIDLRRWPVRGVTTWQLGAGRDLFKGASVHRSIVRAGVGDDKLVSYAARDDLLGEADVDKIADFGGTGDLLFGGAGFDALSSMDGRRDRLDGGADRDFCLTPHGHVPSTCDAGSTLHFEAASYFPTSSVAKVLQLLTIA